MPCSMPSLTKNRILERRSEETISLSDLNFSETQTCFNDT